MNFKIATAQYDISFLENWQQYQEKAERWVAEAVRAGCEDSAFSRVCQHGIGLVIRRGGLFIVKQTAGSHAVAADDYLDLFRILAKKYQCIIQPGTFPVKTDSGAYRNRAYLFMPDGQVDYQDKLMMTRFENEQWLIQKGEELKCFDTEYGKIAINICYDSEFPILARKQVEAGANLILVPSCTDTLAGYHRVKIGCQARALENQCYVVQSTLVGECAVV